MKEYRSSKRHEELLGLKTPQGYFQKSKIRILDAVKEDSNKKKFNIKRIFSYAAAALLIISIGVAYVYFNNPSGEEIATNGFEIIDSENIIIDGLFMTNSEIDDYIDAYEQKDVFVYLESQDKAEEDIIIDMLFVENSLIEDKIDEIVQSQLF